MSAGEKVCVIGAGGSGSPPARCSRQGASRSIASRRALRSAATGATKTTTGCRPPIAPYTSTPRAGSWRTRPLPMPDHYPDYPDHFQMAAYFDEFVDHFGLRERIRFRTEVLERRTGRGRRLGGDGAGCRRQPRERALSRGDGRQRPPLGCALARTGFPRGGGVRGRAGPRPPLPRARRPARQARARARNRQLGDGHRGRVLPARRRDLPGDAPRRLRPAQVPQRQADRRDREPN